EDVTFSWEADPTAASYVVKIGKWPWNVPTAALDPPNCSGPPAIANDNCQKEPREAFHVTATGTSVTVTDGKASKGRYCWRVRPLEVDAHPPPRQPLVVGNKLPLCYTSGPAEPTVTCAPLPAATGFSPDPITCTVDFPYVPDGQSFVTVEGADDAHRKILEDC